MKRRGWLLFVGGVVGLKAGRELLESDSTARKTDESFSDASGYRNPGKFDELTAPGSDATEEKGERRQNDVKSYWDQSQLIPSGHTGYTPSATADTEDVHYFWKYNGFRTAKLEIPAPLYEYYQARPRTQNYGQYAAHPAQSPLLDSALNSIAVDSTGDGREELASVQQFVQGLKYASDRVATGYNEYPKYPVETLVERGGDCEDTAVLMATLFERLGYSSVLLAFWDDEHMALGVAGTIHGAISSGTYYTYNGRKYHYVETTDTGWNIGQQPTEITLYPEIIPIERYPSITASSRGPWYEGGGTFKLAITLRNGGDATASNVYVTATLSAGSLESFTSASAKGFVRFLAADESKTLTLEFDETEIPDVSPGDTPELTIRIDERGRLHDETSIPLPRVERD